MNNHEECQCNPEGATCGEELDTGFKAAGAVFYCTRKLGHEGMHVACGYQTHWIASWIHHKTPEPLLLEHRTIQ